MSKCGIIGFFGTTGLLLFTGCGDHGDSENGDAATLAGDSADGTGGEDAGGSDDGDEDATAGGDESTGGQEPPPAGDGDGDDGPMAPSCEEGAFSVEVQPGTPRVMLVLDKSRSMTAVWDHDANAGTPDITRWNSLHNVVEFLTMQLGHDIEFGAQLFPSKIAWLDEPVNDFSCDVSAAPEVAVGPDQGPAILEAIPAALDWDISGGTPATAGIVSAADHLMRLPGDDPRAIILVTDGAANCNPGEAPGDTLFFYDAQLPSVVETTFDDMGIPVYVVGINILNVMGTKPAVNAYEALNEVALAGGSPAPGADAFYNTFNEIELAAALETVTGQIECTLTLEAEPEYPELVEITTAGATYHEVADCDADNGFVYSSPGGPYNSVRLCGTACDALQGDGGTVSIDYLCPDA
jgi:hypothetical protein